AETKFRAAGIRNVHCSTWHAFGYWWLAHQWGRRRLDERLGADRLTMAVAREALGVPFKETIAPGRHLSGYQIARLAQDAVEAFCISADSELGPQHVKPVTGFGPAEHPVLVDVILSYARKAWADLTNPGGILPMRGGHHLKAYSLADPYLNVGGNFPHVIMLDEAQDTDPACNLIWSRQGGIRVAVGDSAQALYEWRGAVDALDRMARNANVLHLTQSWRFGDEIAAEANKWLTLLGERIHVRGNPAIRDTVGTFPQTRAILCRTNGEALQQVIDQQAQGRTVYLAGRANEIAAFARAAAKLKAGEPCYHRDLIAYSTWGQVQEACDLGEMPDLEVLVHLVDSLTPEGLIAALDSCATTDRRADVTVSTVHGAKGLEWPTVRVGDDFKNPRRADGELADLDPGDIRAAYVAVTRAQHTLDVGSLDFADERLHPTRGFNRRGPYARL
ncbi:MAG TPA: 3'-5' exonuclease, partial [Kineosporiaceae bacterium]|nr:3'-5' exonuclease [Kineosporiaceae bacterium]